MPSFPDTAVLVILALLLFGPKKLPVLARQLGKLMADFRRASNEFRTQMEEELRIAEQADRQKQIAAIEAAAPPSSVPTSPVIDTESNPHLPPPPPSFTSASSSTSESESAPVPPVDSPTESASAPASDPVPIATAGELSILPPSTGLPTPNTSFSAGPGATAPTHESELETETLHG
jgi:sec-independent protein translocase protein TatB